MIFIRIIKFTFFYNKIHIADETLLIVQLLDACLPFQRQEFARIIFVDDINNFTKSFEHHEPLKNRPPFRGVDDSKRVFENDIASN